MIEMNCPHCDHLLRIDDKYAGQKGGCKHCGGHFRVPKMRVPTPPSMKRSKYPAQAPSAAPPVTASKLDDMDDMPEVDPAFAEEMTGEAPPPSTALDDLADDTRDRAAAPVSGRPGPAPQYAAEELGCLFWGAVFLAPPAGLVWSFLVPSGHADKVKAIVTSALFCILGVLSVIAGGALSARTQTIGEAGDERAQSVSQPPAPAPSPEPAPELVRLSLLFDQVYSVSEETPLANAMNAAPTPGGELPPGGMFRPVRAVEDGFDQWFEVVVSDGTRDYVQWIDAKWIADQELTLETARSSAHSGEVAANVQDFLAQYFPNLPVYPGLTLYEGKTRNQNIAPFELNQETQLVFLEGVVEASFRDVSTYYFEAFGALNWMNVRKGNPQQVWVLGIERDGPRAVNVRITRLGSNQLEVSMAVGLTPPSE